MIKTIKIELEVEVYGKYSPQGRYQYDSPPNPECYEIERVMLGTLDLTEQLDKLNFDFAELENQILDNI
jgi:hypothetical protein